MFVFFALKRPTRLYSPFALVLLYIASILAFGYALQLILIVDFLLVSSTDVSVRVTPVTVPISSSGLLGVIGLVGVVPGSSPVPGLLPGSGVSPLGGLLGSLLLF